jgi:hypothetical protein
MDQLDKRRWWNRVGHFYWLVPLVVIPPLLLLVIAPRACCEASAEGWQWLRENALWG